MMTKERQSYDREFKQKAVVLSQARDNAVAASFFKTIKVEWIYGQEFKNQHQAQLSIFHWIESWYNRRRRHSALGYQTIEEYEMNNLNLKMSLNLASKLLG